MPKKIRFTFGQEIRAISVTVDQNLVEFLKQYPQTPFDVYFNAPVSAAAAHDLVEGLAPFIKGKSEVEAVNILLRFVQTAFKYRTDQENFGREKPLFVDETLFYDASDCEDRAVLFSFLVKKPDRSSGDRTELSGAHGDGGKIQHGGRRRCGAGGSNALYGM